jgi:menaquinol-cytochrome c reductase iron-sulfur subunit
MSDDESRRRFLKIATISVGGVIGAVTAVPLVGYSLFPVGRKVVSSAKEPIDVASADDLRADGKPVKMTVVGSNVRNGWQVADDVALGAVWVSKNEAGEVTAFSAVCPHLGCAIDYSEGEDQFRCPCHNSAFKRDGEKIKGPSKRGLDPLPVAIDHGRVKVTWVRFVTDISDRVES